MFLWVYILFTSKYYTQKSFYMNIFERKLEEAASFGLSSHLDVVDLRALYYGRNDVYVSFTDDGDYEIEGSSREMDRPDGIICYEVSDVVGKKVQSSHFYANVFRMKKTNGTFLSDIRYYRKEDLTNDITLLTAMKLIDDTMLDRIIYSVFRDTTIRHEFTKLWTITEFVAKSISSRNFGEEWRDILLSLGYIGFSDPSKTGEIMGERKVVTIYLDYEKRTDLDILPIQKHRTDPRQRVRQRVERKVKRLGVRRRRVAKRRT